MKHPDKDNDGDAVPTGNFFERLKFRLSGILGEDARAIIPRLVRTDGRRHARKYAFAFLMMFLVAAATASPPI